MGYRPTSLVVNKKYHNLKVDYSAGNSSITIGTTPFKLAEFHFHRPSEETIDGHHFEMVIHLVHDKAAPNGPTPVVAILVTTEGTPRENTKKLVDKLIENAPVVNGKVAPREEQINAADLLPPTADNQPLGYYRYDGSLTTPGCKEGVTFYVLKTPVVFSQDQIEKFKVRYPFDNARKTQTTNTSKVEQTVY